MQTPVAIIFWIFKNVDIFYISLHRDNLSGVEKYLTSRKQFMCQNQCVVVSFLFLCMKYIRQQIKLENPDNFLKCVNQKPKADLNI